MEAIKLIGTSQNGILTVAVPDEFNDKELEIMIVAAKDKDKKDIEKIKNNKERIQKFKNLVGSAKHPDFPMTKYDVYDQ